MTRRKVGLEVAEPAPSPAEVVVPLMDPYLPDSLPPAQWRRRQRIIDAALALLEHGEFEAIQMRDVAQRAAVALGTLYRYFNSKEHLYAAAMVQWGAAFRSDIDERSLNRTGDPEGLKELLRRAIRAFERRPQFVRVEIVLGASTDVHAHRLFEQFGEHNMSTFTSALDGLSDEDARDVAQVAAVVMENLLHKWAMGRCSIDDVYSGTFRTVDLLFAPIPGPPQKPTPA
jgi:AcrR family transcriptional regulator